MLHRLFIILIFSSCTAVSAIENDRERITASTLNISSDQEALRRSALSLIGSPYKYGGNTPKGFDCSGFTSYLYKSVLNISLNRSSADQSKMGKPVDLQKLEVGDLVFFKLNPKRKINHVAIVTGNTQDQLIVVHSTTSKGVIKQDILASNYWKSKIVFAKRIL